MRRGLAAVAIALIALTGCAAPASRMGVYPMQGQSLDQQGIDGEDCTSKATTMAGSMGAETATGAAVGIGAGAIIGATLGAIAGAFFGVAGEGAAIGAALGGATGGLRGAASGAGTNQDVRGANFAACMTAKGYSVAR
jgi:hypothetical protein